MKNILKEYSFKGVRRKKGEVFKRIPGFEDLYAVSNKGRVVSLNSGSKTVTLKRAKTYVPKKRTKNRLYGNVTLGKNYKFDVYSIDFLVYAAFKDNLSLIPAFLRESVPMEIKSLYNRAGERFVDIKGFDGMYQISNFGRVRSYRTTGGKFDFRSYIYLRPATTPGGHKHVVLSKNGVEYSIYPHRLVAEYFVTKRNKYDRYVIFKDGDHTNIRPSNLKWVPGYGPAGLTAVDIFKIRKMIKKGETYEAVAKKYKISTRLVYLIKFGKIWSHVQN